MMMTSKRPREKASHVGDERGYEALQSMLTGEYTEESTGARTIRQTGGKDRHSKVFTSRGPRDRRVRLSVATAIRFYDLQDRLGFEQPSKAVEWLLLHCQKSIQALPQLGSQLHLHVQQLAALPLSANPGNHPAPHNIQPMELKPSDQEYILNYRRLQNQRFGQDSLYHTHPLLHNTSHLQLTPLPQLNDIIQAQDSIEEELPQSSGNPSSSGASSDHPIPLSEVSQQHHAGDTGANSRQASMPTDIPPSLLCMSKRRRIQSSSNASHSSLHHYANPDLHAGFVQVDGNEMHTGTMSAIGDRQYCGMETERSWMAAAGTDNAMSNIDCSVISTGAGAVKNDAKPSDNYSLISKIMSSTSNLPTYMNQSSSDFLMSTQGALQGQMNIAGAGMQPNMLSLPSRVEANPYINNIQLMAAKQELLARAQITCAGMSEQTSISPVQVVQGPDLMSGIKYMDDINMQLMSGKNMTANQRSGPNIMYIASDLSPSESNNIGIDPANYAGKPGSSSSSAERQQTRADGAHQQMLYRPSSIWDWTVIKHATLP